MNRSLLFVIVTLLSILSSTALAQEKSHFVLFPDGMLFNNLQGNIREPRFGLIYFPDNANLKLDIGYTSDLFEYNVDDRLTFRAGIDFFAYGLATSYKGNRLQIDMLDGFFGGNLTSSYKMENGSVKGRFRILHNSAHLVDGSFDKEQDDWKDGYAPIPFTRDFGEITLLREFMSNGYLFSFYGSTAYSTLARPSTIKKWTYNFGSEIVSPELVKNFYDRAIVLFFIYHNELGGEESYISSHTLKAGVKFGKWDSKGLLFFAFYYDGFNYFNEFYNQRISKFGIGFNVDFSSAFK